MTRRAFLQTSLLATGIYVMGSDLAVQLKFGKLASNRTRDNPLNPLATFFRSAEGRWFKDLAKGGEATLEVAGRRVPVKAMPAVDAGSIERASAEYLRKYRTSPYAQAMVKAETLPTTLRLEPR